ncbi:hypothetical protein L3X38_036563 [Prunus dulcis]|uniref:Uncharacterized protein n=1 Tax=Prunus dulcis TaxID=3755 RepID=A0AAD4V315_PRUDU|nr:hypothetical protein L3X38_036563 [Prunus dulcis]
MCYHPPSQCTDVTFLEFETFFHDRVSSAPLQGETRSKAQTWSTLEDGKFEVWMKTTGHFDNNDWSLQTEEIKALEKNQTWTLEILPPEKRTVGCRRVFIAKHNADGSVE